MKDSKTQNTADSRRNSPTNPNDLEEQVRLRAYELYERRGESPGDAVSDWLEAEQEIIGTAAEQKMKAAA